MGRRTALSQLGVAVLVIGLLASAPARAEMRDHPGGGPEHGHDEHGRDDHGRDEHGRPHFSDHDRVVVHDYYGEEFHHGRCPPGLAKKHEGCMPVHAERRWVIGRPLPRDVIFYDVPPVLIQRLPPPPRGYRYVRVSSDILLIAIGTGLVIDAIRDLGGA